MPKKTLQGNIVSNKAEKTVVVKVSNAKFNAKYKRYYTIDKKYHAHVENSKDFEIGQKVSIQECAPISKTKKWKVVNK